MSPSQIIRLRGDAPDLVWPIACLAPRLDWCAELRRLTPDHVPYTADAAVRRASSEQLREWDQAMLAARTDAAAEFAAAQGWAIADRDYRARRLVGDRRERRELRKERARRQWLLSPWEHRSDILKHPDWFRIGQRQVAAVVHLYRPLAIDALPASVVIDQLAASWYYPQLTTAYVYRPAGVAQQGFP